MYKSDVSSDKICHYYQARVDKKRAWFVMGVFRNEDNIAFVRALDGGNEIFEFFVPEGFEKNFLPIIKHLEDNGYLSEFIKMPNRFA